MGPDYKTVDLTYGKETRTVYTEDVAWEPSLTHDAGDMRYWRWQGRAFRTYTDVRPVRWLPGPPGWWWRVDVWEAKGWVKVGEIYPGVHKFEPDAVEIAARMIGAGPDWSPE